MNYASVELISSMYHSEDGKQCPLCKENVILGVIDGSVECSFVLDGIDSNRALYASNCRLCCHCNVEKGSRYNFYSLILYDEKYRRLHLDPKTGLYGVDKLYKKQRQAGYDVKYDELNDLSEKQ